MLPFEDLKKLAKVTAKADPYAITSYSFNGVNFSYSDLDDTLRHELNELVGTPQLFRKNHNLLFELMEETINDYLPVKVISQYGPFAEIKTYAQGTRPVFTQKITTNAKRRAKQFVTKVGLAGIYEVFKLDGKSYEVPTSAYGAAAQIGFEEYLDGRVDFADVLNIIMEGLDEALYIEIERALIGSVTNLQTANKVSNAGFIEKDMDRLIAVADSYGGKSTIYCTFEFAGTMIPSEGWISDDMKNQKWNNGYLGNYKGHQVIVLNQSYEDETNLKKVIDPSYAWIIPGGINEKPIKVALEGSSIVRNIDNADMSKEIQIYKKMGVAAIVSNNICVYKNTDLTLDTITSN